MKNVKRSALCLGTMLFLAMIFSESASAQVVQATGKNAIPADVMKIFQRSCAKCHIDGESGGLKFTAWETYTPEKQVSKAKAINNEVSKDFMPPDRFLKNNPGAALTPVEKKAISDWVTSVTSPKK